MADRNNVLHIQFTPCSNNYETDPLYQYDYGQLIKFSGVTLPDLYEVHFAHSKHGEAKTVLGNSDGVAIPDEYLETAAKIYGWIYLHSGEDDGETVYRFVIPVLGRAKPTHEEPTPVQQSEIEQLIATLEDLIENGDWSGGGGGADGVSPTVTITEITGGHRVTITDKDHPDGQSFDVLNGEKGDKGERGIQGIQGIQGNAGRDGTDGVSPTISVTAITGGHRLTITDAEHPSGMQFDVMDGANGRDGTNGTNGSDGVSPVVSISAITGGNAVTITDATHPQGQTFNVMNGTNGNDYVLTAQDKSDIAQLVVGLLPTYNGQVVSNNG